MMKYAYGALPDRHDDRDLRLSRLTRALAAVPPAYSLRDRQSPVRDQGRLGACTGFALTSLLESLRILAGDPSELLSPLWLYYYERQKEHSIAMDAGASTRDGLSILRSRGCAPEVDWPYDPLRFREQPSAVAKQDARQFRIHSYHRAQNLFEIRQAIGALHVPVAMGIPVFESFESDAVDATGIVPVPDIWSENLLGGHAILAVGYDDATARVCFKNSWSSGWGDRGFGYLPYEYFARVAEVGVDLWTASLS